MRMMLPTLRDRRNVDRYLRAFFTTHSRADFRRAISMICRFYDIKPPVVEWFEYLDWGKGAGRTYENGKIHLLHPESWKRGRKYNSMKQWIHTVHHEMGHYLFWTDAERKADLFAANMMNGVPSAVGEPERKPLTRIRMTGTRRSVGRPRART